MKRAAAALVLFGIVMVPACFLAIRCRGEASRTHEAVLKDSIVCVQRAIRRVAAASDFESCLAIADVLRAEAARLRELMAEFGALPAPSRWERSRMRKNRQLAETTLDSWADTEKDFRTKVDESLPPHARVVLNEALGEFDAARAEAWELMMTWD